MTDVTTKKPLYVSTEGTAGPYIMVPETQLARVEALLSENGIPFWTDQDVISIGGGPAVGVINLGRSGNAGRVQALLDSAGHGGGTDATPE